ncbi:synaptogenesis protein syg-2-like isoform X7 [Diachasmimorpha longicaudata]|uniref:synaptogenesis protein syg-2-like isoform X7 n=1 Tax=Diachasmimorpha longicaudata TaxID=58733 RepID=UPI0030B8E75C
MRYPSTAVTILIVFFASVRAQGIPRTFLARPFRGGPPVQVRAVVDGVAELPCDIRPPQPNDSAVLVVWYKASERLPDLIPIYSYDTRSKHPDKAAHWKDKEYLNERGHFKTATEPAILNIRRVEQRDEGEYLCRVDFVKSPTRNSKIYLTIIVPPHKPNIIDEHGKTVSTVAGPYEEGGSMRLTCLVSGGRPAPTVRWWRGETLLESKDEPGEFPALRRNTLIVTELTRADLHAAFTCQASNNNISQPVSASVIIEMHLRPLTVEILSSEHAPLSADRKYDINCRTMGSRPSAKLSWFMEGKMLKNSTQRFSEDGNMTMSTLTFTPTREDHDKLITCRAENSNVDGGFEEDTWKLNIFFVPILKLELGSKMNPDDIEEGDDVYFECKVRANPEAYKVVWKHNGMVIHNNAKKGVIVQQYSLALRQVDRFQAGNYMCVASNVEGDGYSGTVELKIMYKPICIPDQKRIYGVGRLEEAKVVCRVEAYPPPSNFRWAFNNTEEMADVPQARYKNSTRHTQSVLTYKPVTEMDYGTVLCWASNTAGQQANACIFHIIPAGKPEAPYNCTLTNQTTESLSIECSAGFDGGQPQNFLLEVYDQYTGILQANVTSRDNAAFTVQDLEPGKVLTMKMYAYNSRGRSESTKLEGFTLKVAEKQTDSDYQLTGSTAGTPLAVQVTPDQVSTTSLPNQQTNHLQGLSAYAHNEYNNYPTLPLTGEVTYAELCLARPTTLSTTADTKLACLSGVGGLGGFNNANNNGGGGGSGGGGGGGGGVLVGGKPYIKEATVYACIDHNARVPKIDQICQSTKASTVGLLQDTGVISTKQHHPREVVTVRTPLISTQESCV